MGVTMATLQQQLDDAKSAYHELVCGRAPRVIVDSNGERVEFSRADRQQLYLYIQQLELQVAGVTSPQPITETVNGPVRFIF